MVKTTQSTRPIKVAEITRSWHLIDVGAKTLGREIPRIAELLQGKHKVQYVPYLDTGDYVVIINAKTVTLTGKKEQQKEYTYYSGYPGGQRLEKFKNLRERNARELIRHAVSGMLPKNKLRDQRLARLYIFEGAEHTYTDKFK